MNTKRRIVDGLHTKWNRHNDPEDTAGFKVYCDAWFAKLSAANHRKINYLMAKQACSCFYCKRTMSLGRGTVKKLRPTIEHKKLQSKGGTFSLSNIVLACSECNNLRNDMDFDEFYGLVKELGFTKARKKVIHDRQLANVALNKANKAKNLARQNAHILWCGYLLFILDRLGMPWYSETIIKAQNAAKEAMKRDRRILEPA